MPIRLSHITFITLLVALWFPASVQGDSIKAKIAVLDFELCGDKFSTDGLGSMVAEWFVTALVKDGRFEVIERALLQTIIAEQKLGETGVLDDSSASQIGKILGVKIIISGSVLNLGKMVEINARIISVEDGTIGAAESIKGSVGGDLQKIVEDLTAKIVRNFPLTGYVVKKDATGVIIDLGKDTGVQTGMEFIVFKEGKTINHPKTGEVLDVERIHTGRIKITRIHGNVADAAIVKEETDGIEYGQLVSSVQEKKKTPSPAAAEKNAPKSSVAQEVRLADSPVFDEGGKQKPTEKPLPAQADTPTSKTAQADRPPSPPRPDSKRHLAASTPGCQDLLKSWQLGDSSVMQRYLKECSQ